MLFAEIEIVTKKPLLNFGVKMTPEEKKWVENLINDTSPNEMKMVRLVCIIEKQERVIELIKKTYDFHYKGLLSELEEMER